METTIFIRRLVTFSKHLATLRNHSRQKKITTVTLYATMQNFRLEYEINIPGYITLELARVFPVDWHYNFARKEYALVGIPDYAPAEAGIGGFFGLDEDEFLHCFSLTGSIKGYHKPDVFGGQILTEKSTPKDIAKNLSDLSAYKLFQVNFN